MGNVKFTFDQEKAMAAIAWLAAQHIPELSKGKTCKLIFLAEKHHLVRFGRPITGDRICAMKDGPVPSSVLDLLNLFLKDPQDATVRMLAQSISIDRVYVQPRFSASQFDFPEFLSPSDLESLRYAVERFGDRTFSELRAITHDMPAYKNAWEQGRPYNSPTMAFEDFFEEDDNAIEGALEEMIENFQIENALAPV